MSFATLLQRLGLPREILDCASGRTEAPVIDWEHPPGFYGFPPALIPIWSDGSGPSYLGYWKHWFSDRPGTFVKMYGGPRRETVEIARTPEQFLIYGLIKGLCVYDGITPALKDFANRAAIMDIEAIDDWSLKTGDNLRKFAIMPAFAKQTPRESAPEPSRYDGFFPGPEDRPQDRRVQNACLFELAPETIEAFNDGTLPEYLGLGQGMSIFQLYIQRKQWREAWLSLNRPGWHYAEVREALDILLEKTGERHFSLLVEAWKQASGDRNDSY